MNIESKEESISLRKFGQDILKLGVTSLLGGFALVALIAGVVAVCL